MAKFKVTKTHIKKVLRAAADTLILAGAKVADVEGRFKDDGANDTLWRKKEKQGGLKRTPKV